MGGSVEGVREGVCVEGGWVGECVEGGGEGGCVKELRILEVWRMLRWWETVAFHVAIVL